MNKNKDLSIGRRWKWSIWPMIDANDGSKEEKGALHGALETGFLFGSVRFFL